MTMFPKSWASCLLVFLLLGLLCNTAFPQAAQIDPSFNTGTGFNGTVYGTIEQPNGKLLVFGSFSTFNGTARARIARLNQDGSLDTSFLPSSSSSTIYCAALLADGKILVGGSSIGSAPSRYWVARLNADGSLDALFDPGSSFDSTVYALSVQSDGKIVVG